MATTRRQFVYGASAGLAVGLAGGTWLGGHFFAGRSIKQEKAALTSPYKRKPNIVLIIADDMRYDALGVAGNSNIKTPYLDRLAAESDFYENAFVTTSICPTSRASIMTGQYASSHGVWNFTATLATKDVLLPALLRKSGYHTGFVGKWGIASLDIERLFDVWNGFHDQGRYVEEEKDEGREHLTNRQTEQSEDFLRSAPADKPFFLSLSYKAPHGPLITQDEWRDYYADVAIPRAETDSPYHYGNLPALLVDSNNRNQYIKRLLDNKNYASYIRQYYALVTGLDFSVGYLLQVLKDIGAYENTLIVFTSDNGMLLGEHGLIGKWCMYEESIRIPLIIKWPHEGEPEAARQISDMALNIDIAPTLLHAADSAIPPGMKGMSLLGLKAGDVQPRQQFYYEQRYSDMRITPCQGIRTQKWKYTRYYRGAEQAEVLYDIAQDPMETHNLAGEKRVEKQLVAMRKACLAAAKDA